MARDWRINRHLTRRDLLKVTGYGGLAALVAACGGTAGGGTGGGGTSKGPITATGGSLTIGSNASDPLPLAGMQAVNSSFSVANGGTQIKLNTVDHGTFQDQISSYLQGTPEDVFTWFSGHRMRFFANEGLATPIDDVWDKVKDNFGTAFAAAVKGTDGHVYGIPTDYYPWGIFYRKSLFQERGYKVPTNWQEFKTLCSQMKKDGLAPIALGDKDGWPAQGTFDFLDMKLNGYDFHTELLTGKQKFTDKRVTRIFSTWAEITPYYNDAAPGMTWQEASQLLIQKKAGMYPLGLFVAQQFQAVGPSEVDDLDFFPWPDMGTRYDAEKALDAPIDIMMLSKRSQTLTSDLGQAKAYLEFWAKGSTQLLDFKQSGGGTIPTANDTDTSGYSPLVKKAVQVIKEAKRLGQFFDRDSRPDFAGPNGMQSFLLTFLQSPKGDIQGLQGTMQKFWDSLPPEQ